MLAGVALQLYFSWLLMQPQRVGLLPVHDVGFTMLGVNWALVGRHGSTKTNSDAINRRNVRWPLVEHCCVNHAAHMRSVSARLDQVFQLSGMDIISYFTELMI